MENGSGELLYKYKALNALGTTDSRTSVEEEQPRAREQADAVEEDFIALIDSEALGERLAAEQEEEERPTVNTAPSTSGRTELPWTRASAQISSPSIRLHNELVELVRFLQPTLEETSARMEALERISRLVKSIFPTAEVKVFGSFLTGLYLPTSDMDVVVLNSRCSDKARGLKAISALLIEQNMGKNVQVISHAKVPIVKFDDVATGYAFDISFDVNNGPESAKHVLGLMKVLPQMRHLVIVLKLFMQQRDLNEVYQGGIGSYALLVMVAVALLQHPSRQPTKHDPNPTLEPNLGILLMDFFRLYGRTLNYEDVGISCRSGGAFFARRDRPSLASNTSYYNSRNLLVIEDPQDTLNDLGRSSYNYKIVQRAFDVAYQQLSSPSSPDQSLLERIVRLDAVLMARAPAQGLGPADEVPPPPPTVAGPEAQHAAAERRMKSGGSRKPSGGDRKPHKKRAAEAASSKTREREREFERQQEKEWRRNHKRHKSM